MKHSLFTKKLSRSFIALMLICAGLLWAGKAEASCKASFTDTVKGKTVYFYNTSSASNLKATKFIWHFGDGSDSRSSSTYHTYSAYSTSYTVCLYIDDTANSCTDSICTTITTGSVPCSATASFKYSVGSGGTVTFTNSSTTSSGHYSSSWDFQDKTSSTDKSPTHTFKANGVYHVCLTVTDSVSKTCTSSYCTYVTVSTSTGCIASYSSSVSGAVLNTSNTSIAHNSYTSTWSWGDGSSNTVGASPKHTYASNGKYNVCLTIFDSLASCSSSKCDTITITGACTTAFKFTISGFTVAFNDSGSTGLAHKHSTTWNFHDGTAYAYTDKPTHTFPSKAATFDVCCYIYDSVTGCSSSYCQNVSVTGCTLTASFTDTATGYKVRFFGTTNASKHSRVEWYFGDGKKDSTSGLKVTHLYDTTASSEVVYLLVYDSTTKCATYYRVNLTFCTAYSSFTSSGNGLTVSFASGGGTSSHVKYSWNFGDKGTSDNQNPKHTFASAGTYNVCLTATDTVYGCHNTTCKNVDVTSCSLTASYADSIAGRKVYFVGTTNASSHRRIEWYFGDGSLDTSNTLSTTHTYGSSVDSEKAYFIVYDSATKCNLYISKEIKFCTSRSDFGYLKSTSNGLELSFSSDSLNKATVKYSWSFGDKGTSDSKNPTHTYSTSGTYDICLTATDSISGCSSTTCHSIAVSNCNLSVGFYDTVDNHKVSFYGFTNASKHSSIKWYFGDGSYDSTGSLHPVHTFGSSVTTASVTLRVYDSTTKCLAYATHSISFCHLSAAWTYAVSGKTVKFFPDSTNPSTTKYYWGFGDGSSSSTTKDPTHTYSANGKYRVCLYASDSPCYAEVCDSITISSGSSTYCIGGKVTTGKTAAYPCKVYLITYDSKDSSLSALDSTTTDSLGEYIFCSLPNGTYYTKAALTKKNAYYSYFIPTYHVDATKWASATKITISGASVTNGDIKMKLGTNPGGAGFIGGKIKAGANKTGDAEANVLVILYDANQNPVTYTYSDQTGYYSFSGIAFGTYSVEGEIPGKVCYPAIVTITDSTSTDNNVDLEVNMTTITAAVQPIATWTVEKTIVYPNPVADKMNVSMNLQHAEQVNVKIFDMTGKTVSTEQRALGAGLQNVEFNASALPAGLYLLRMEMPNDNKLMEARFVKAH